jgi:hypothetical protein
MEGGDREAIDDIDVGFLGIYIIGAASVKE